jgi:3-dehydroquinate synthase
MKRIQKSSFKKTTLYVGNSFPRPSFLGKDVIIIIDRKIISLIPGLSAWLSNFSAVYRVTAGEELKSLDKFSKHMEKILKMSDSLSLSKLKIVAIGGGSLGDFAGFVASVLKRGVGLIHIPTTWLAAIDSAHGGKTALNAGKSKNQIGTFYPAESVLLVKKILMGQPLVRGREAISEMVKMAFLTKKRWASSFFKSKLKDNRLLWEFLVDAIKEKYDVVERDPFEKKGDRRVLNLGHTFGHVIEAYYGLPHGRAVMVGMNFAAHYSRQKGLLTEKEYQKILNLLDIHSENKDLQLATRRGKIDKKTFYKLALRDKKRSKQSKIIFIFFKKVGSVVQREVDVKDFYDFAKKQNWVK